MFTVHDRIARHAEEISHAAALIYNNELISYQRLEFLLDCVAFWLNESGVSESDVVALSIPDPLSQLLFSLALLRTGATQTILSATQTPFQSQEQCDLAEVTILVGQANYKNVRTLPVDQKALNALMQDKPPSRSKIEIDPKNVAFVFQGSGTTGDAKLIPISHQNVFYRVINLYGQGHVGGNQRTIVLQNNASLAFMFRTLAILYNGGCAVGNPADDNFSSNHCEKLFQSADRYGVDHLHCTAYHAELLVRSLPSGAAPRLPNLKTMLVGASTVSNKLRSEVVDKITPNLCINYGSNESGDIARAWPKTLARHPESVGVVNPVSQVEIFDSGLNAVPRGERGLIWVKGPSVIDGYAGNVETNRNSFANGWFNTGDMGHLTSDGVLYHHGRQDDMIIMAGFNIYPAELERVMETHPAVSEVAIVGMPSKVLQSVPIAFVVKSAECSEAELSRFCVERLGNQSPREIRFCDSLPRNSSGKVQKRKLIERLRNTK